ncbi:MAG: pilus assembly protein TadG-related protein [Nocardioidaceae bacterium]
MRTFWIRRRRSQRGALTPAVVVIALGLLLLGGLVIDGGRHLNLKARAQATAEEAARAGANMLKLTQDEPVIDKDRAAQAVGAFCARAIAADSAITQCGVDGFGHETQANGNDVFYVQARVEVSDSSTLLGIIGVHDLTADVTAKASAVKGVFGPGKDKFSGKYTPSVSYPPYSVTVSTSKGNPTISFSPPDYPTTVCGVVTTLPATQGVDCTPTKTKTVTTTTKTKKNPHPPPPSTKTTIKKTKQTPTTIWTTFPTTVLPSGWDG